MSNQAENLSCDLDLAQASQRLNAHIQNSPLAVIEWDQDYQIIRWSGRAGQIFGWQAEEVLGLSFANQLLIFYEPDLEQVLSISYQLMQGDLATESFQYRNYTKSGKIIWCEWYNSAIYDLNGKISSVLSFALDISDRIAAEQKTTEAQKRYQTLFNCEDDSVVIHGFTDKGMPSRFIEVNDAACRNLGYSREKLLTMSPIDVSEPSPKMRSIVSYLLAKGQAVFETVHVTSNGTKIPVEVRAHLLEDQTEPTVISFARDIRIRNRTEQEILYSRDLLNSIFDQSTDAIFLSDFDTNLIFDCNRRAVELFAAFDKDQLIGIRGGSLQKTPCSSAEHQRMKLDLATNNFFSFETEYLTANGDIFWGSLTIKTIEIAQKKINLIRLTDITEKKKYELEIVQKNQALELSQLEAESANRAKSSFLAMMSHEIRTPLNAILGTTELLFATELDEDQLDHVKTMNISGDLLLTVINDILDFSKFESGYLELESQPFSLYDCIAESIRLNANRASQKQIGLLFKIDPDCPEFFEGDQKRLSQILINLLSNGIKFTSDGEVSLKLTSKLVKPKTLHYQLLFAVKDTGIGIPTELADRLFRPFSQVDSSTTRKYGGTGLGLAICKLLCQKMGGEIWFESKVNQGSTFYLAIELQAIAQSKPIVSVTTELQLPQSIKILLVEDNQINIRLAQKMLARLGYNIDVAKNGIEAVKAVSDGEYDLVFMDVLMPEMDGLEATAQICSQIPVQIRPWIIAMTANAMEGDRQACLDAGMNDYISKPVSVLAISTAIKNWWSQAQT